MYFTDLVLQFENLAKRRRSICLSGIVGICVTLLVSAVYGESIVVDGRFSEWSAVPTISGRGETDYPNGEPLITEAAITNDAARIYMRLRFSEGQEIALQRKNGLTLYLSTSRRPGQSVPLNDFQANVVWEFGEINGIVYEGSSPYETKPGELGLVVAPTVTSNEFEIALDLKALARVDPDMSPEEVVSLALVASETTSGRRLASSGELRYRLSSLHSPPVSRIEVEKQHADSIRLLTYNVLDSGIFDPGRQGAFRRLLAAIDPDILVLQEMTRHTESQIVKQVARFLDLSEEIDLHAVRSLPDLALVSRFPIKAVFPLRVRLQYGTASMNLIDLRPHHESDLLVVNAHLPCCDFDRERQATLDELIHLIRDAKEDGGLFTLDPRTPIVVCGDFNFVSYASQVDTLLKGDLGIESGSNQQLAPDWDDSPLSDALPRHTDSPFTFTWAFDGSSYSPGRLDYVAYSDSVLKVNQSYVLYTPGMSLDTLNRNRLQRHDSIRASDHFPVVVDFSLSGQRAETLR